MRYQDILPSLFTPNSLLFISEDIEFIQNYLKHQYKSSSSRLQSIYYIASSSALGSLLYFSRPIPILFRCSIGLFLIIFTKYGCPLLFRKFVAFNIRKKYKNFSDGLIYNNHILRKLLNLCEETQRVEQRCSYNSNWSTRLLQSTFEVNVKILHLLREFTLRSFSDLGFAEGFDHEENYVSCLPSELFNDILSEKNPSITHLKNLVKLTRIQQSQLVRRILCSGSANNEYKCLKLIRKFINDIEQQIEPLRNQLTSLYTFHNALWTGENNISAKNFDIDKFHLLALIKLSRIHIRSSLFELSEIENITTNYKISDIVELRNKLYNVEQELKSGLNVILKLITDLTKKIEPKKPEKPIEIPKEVIEPSNVVVDENYQPEVADRVYELDFDESCDVVPKNEPVKDDFYPEFHEIFATLQDELQTALLPKAEEHRIREANVLGVPVDSITIQVGNKKSKNNTSESINATLSDHSIKTTSDSVIYTPKPINVTVDQSMQAIPKESSDMISLLAKNASEKSKLYNVSSNIEKLGDFDDDDSDEEEGFIDR